MSIKTKLLVACVLLMAINASIGAFSQLSQRRIAGLGIDIYDRAFLAMSYLRSAQNGLSKLRTGSEGLSFRSTFKDANRIYDTANPANSGVREPNYARPVASDRSLDSFAAAVPDILSDVQVAHDRAMSIEGADATHDLARQLDALSVSLTAHDFEGSRAGLNSIQAAFDIAVEIYAGDGYVFRHDVQKLLDRSMWNTSAAMATATIIALTITVALGASILPALRNAVDIAKAISAGRLDSEFPRRSLDETGILMRALSDMRDSLVDKIARIDGLAIESQARSVELSIQNARFTAALDNMHHGLCMVDVEQRLTVANRRFIETFGQVSVGMDCTALPHFPRLVADTQGSATATKELPDGRVLRISSQSVHQAGWVVTFENITDRHRAESQLRYMSRHDALTGMPNRVLFRECVETMLADVGHQAGLALLYLDLDGFKTVNDTLGHGVGDDLLRGVATRLQNQLRSDETAARLGGDEFAIVIRSGDELVAEHRAMAIIAALQHPFDLPPHRVMIGASVGVSIHGTHSEPGMDPLAVLLKKADVALYRAKAEGKSTYRTHSDALDAALIERRALELDLRTALENKELVLYFQPIVRAATGEAAGFEALLRWHNPKRGVISPTAFIPLAEETGMIGPIGQWVLGQACLEAARWPVALKVAVNLSPVQFRQGFLIADIKRALAQAQLSPQRLELEITESVLLQDKDSVLSTLHQMRDLGVKIALDDFGTGYSSLSYLSKFPFDKLKIDRSFVQNLGEADNTAILRAMVELGRALRLTMVAEGIETEEQAERLRQEGCSELQGFWFGRPRPASDVSMVIRELAGADPSSHMQSVNLGE